jgi:hypothetical protein
MLADINLELEKVVTSLVYLLTAISTAGEPKARPKLTGPKMAVSRSHLE